VLFQALTRPGRATDLQSAEGLEAGLRLPSQRQEGRWPREGVQAGCRGKALKGEPQGRYRLKQCREASGEGRR
jgi:hypothetical protein